MKHGSMVLTIFALFLFFSSCNNKPSPPSFSLADSMDVVNDNMTYRAEVDSFFRTDPASPFQQDTSIAYHGIKWFPIDVQYRGRSVLHRYENPDTVIVLGTKGEERKQLRYGYFEFSVPNVNGEYAAVRLNVYKLTPYDSKRYALYKDNLSVWFTDRTTGNETYEVGRYVEVGNEDPDPMHVYTIDLNKAYNPYCAYSALYSCAIPRKEDHIDLTLKVGERKYHD